MFYPGDHREQPVNQSSSNAGLLRACLAAQSDAGLDWLDATAAQLAGAAPDRALFAAFAAAPGRVGRDELGPCALHDGVHLAGWTRDQAARVLLLLARPSDDGFLPALDRLFAAADLAELVCLYQALPLLPFPERLTGRAAEGIRSNMLPVFKAVALGNPYPAGWLDEGAWNQMVLKAVFTSCPLGGIAGLDRRANPTLARMLVDYARERRAAGRPVAPDLWRPVGPFAAGESALRELRLELEGPDPARQGAAALALAASPDPAAPALLELRPGFAAEIREGRLSWETLAA